MRKKRYIILLLILCCVCLCSCTQDIRSISSTTSSESTSDATTQEDTESDNETYNKLKTEGAEEWNEDIKKYTGETINASDNVKTKTIVSLEACARSLKKIAPFIIIVFMTIGILILLLVHNEKTIRKKAIFTFILGIPIFMIVGVYVFCFAVSMINNK